MNDKGLLQGISRYRTHLMGIAIIAVLAGHFAQLSGCGDILRAVCGLISLMVFTEGFLFLSGFGLYYSFSGNGYLKTFYRKRLMRLLLPYVMLSVVYFVVFDLIMEGDAVAFAGHVSSLAFWYEGNYCGMWYISLSVLLYAVFPVLYRIMFKKSGGVSWLGVAMVLVAVWAINFGLWSVFPEYYGRVKIALSQIPCFVLGMVAGYYSRKRELSRRTVTIVMALLVAATAVYWVIGHIGTINVFFGSVAFKLLTLAVCVVVLLWLDDKGFLRKIDGILLWLGEYTLELYVLHLLIYNVVLKTSDSKMLAACLMIVGAFLLCVPMRKIISAVTDRLSRVEKTV